VSVSSPLHLLTRRTDAAVVLAVAIAAGAAVAAATYGVSASPKLALGGAIALAAVVTSVQWPGLGLAVLVALTYAQGFVVIKEHGGVPSAALPFATLLVAIAFLTPARDSPFLPSSAAPALAAFAAYGGWLVVSEAWAQDGGLTLRAAGAYGKLMIMVVAVLALVRTQRRLAVALWAAAGAAGLLALMTLLQRLDSGLTFFGFAQPAVGELTRSGGTTRRAVGPVGNPNAYAQMLVVAVPLAAGRVVCERRLVLRFAAAAAFVCSIVAIVLTYSRGAFVGLAAVLVLCVARYRRTVSVVVATLATAAVVVGFGVASGFGTRLDTLRQAFPFTAASRSVDPSLAGRAALLRAGIHIWREHPLGGVGYANFSLSYGEYNRHVGTDPALGDTPHDTPLEVLSETGLVGLILWVLLFAVAFTSLRRGRGQAGAAADFLAISLVGYLVTSLFIGGSNAMLAWLLLALCVSVPAVSGPHRAR
jgi:O-antigen ligase